ncbi:hypothetical protein Tco_0194982 [Tanacetum coccineum]
MEIDAVVDNCSTSRARKLRRKILSEHVSYSSVLQKYRAFMFSIVRKCMICVGSVPPLVITDGMLLGCEEETDVVEETEYTEANDFGASGDRQTPYNRDLKRKTIQLLFLRPAGSRYIVTPAGMETTSRNQVTSGRDQPTSNIKLSTAETKLRQQKQVTTSRNKSASRNMILPAQTSSAA